MALDLETTGLNPQLDTIIEVGAVKFQGHGVVENYHSLVNPYQPIRGFVKSLTGITQKEVDSAPPFGVVAGELGPFIGDHPVVGHNVSFDLDFLTSHGLRLSNQAIDTWDLASTLLPYSLDYTLAQLVTQLSLQHPRPHRALPDAQAARQLFVTLLERARDTDPSILSFIGHLASRSQWPVGLLLRGLVNKSEEHTARVATSLMGINTTAVGERLESPSRLKPAAQISSLDEDDLVEYLSPGGMFAKSFPGFEDRPQQVEMLREVVHAFDKGGALMVEAGTGVGKSLAYLLPAVLFSLKNGSPVVISTNTINLQDQLLQKDIPALSRVLEEAGAISPDEFKAVPLKGRANYLCLRRWTHMSRGETLSPGEARLLSKTLMWMQDTSTGDRGEINLSGRDDSIWSRLSAGDREWCPGSVEGTCFLRAARERAGAAHVIVVNHALLLSDMKLGGGILPDYQHLIVDEAHHLEEEATHQLGLRLPQSRLGEELDRLARLLGDARIMLRGLFNTPSQRQRGEELINAIEGPVSRLRVNWNNLWSAMEGFLRSHREEGEERFQIRITPSVRAQPGWSHLEIGWENVDVVLADVLGQMSPLHIFWDSAPNESILDKSTLVAELSQWQEGMAELRTQLKEFLAAPLGKERIDWLSQDERTSSLTLHSAPLNVGGELERNLFSSKRCVVLTSATLTTQGSFDYLKERLGLSEASELAVGSPFDYRQAALLLLPEDIPPPNVWGYQEALQDVLVGLGKVLKGHSLVLFTSHAALRTTAQAIRGVLEPQGVQVLAQGVDGSPRQIFRRFLARPESVLLGTSSFWEGVDLSGGVLKALVLARLPFQVPTEPIFAARSELFENPFNQYAIPQAILRFRQGFGRLIRGSKDRGVIVVMDRRIVARSYSKAFLDSLPPSTVKRVPYSSIATHAHQWVQP